MGSLFEYHVVSILHIKQTVTIYEESIDHIVGIIYHKDFHNDVYHTEKDILEEIVGEIWDEHDEVNSEIEVKSETEFVALGTAKLDKLFEVMNMMSMTWIHSPLL